ncbi:O-antigen ligase family protein [Nitrospina sp. 32_T5]|uniref:O-antigen ligase family protein n=1 Tax=unclassified Nitrospina TaxID=2638683 RepID=UPI003F965626
MISQARPVDAPVSLRASRAHKAGLWLTVLTGAVIPVSTSLTEILTTLVLVLWFVAGHHKTFWTRMRSHPVARSAVILYLMLILGVLYTSADLRDAFGILGKYRELILIVAYLSFLDNDKTRRMCLVAFGAAMVLTLMGSFFQYYIASPSTDPNLRVGLPFKNSITHSLLMAVFAFGLMVHVFSRRENRNRIIALSVLLAVVVFNLFFMVDGRTGYVLFYLLGFLFLFQKFKLRYAMMGVAVLVAFHFTLSSVSPLYQTQWDFLTRGIAKYMDRGDAASSIGMRIEFSTNSYEIMMERPLFGHGTGSFRQRYADHAATNQLERVTDNPHNEYLMLGVQTGWMGIGLFLYFIFTLWRYSFSLDPYHRSLAQGLAVMVTFGALANSLLMDHTEGMLIGWLAAVLYAPLVHDSKTENA